MPAGAYDDAAVQRRVGAPASPGRTPFQRDRARVLHSRALRTLAGKTQVVEPGGLHSAVPRTRLTHSLECAQIGRELGAALGCDPDLVDAACLAHDLGHPPFGHNGETALDEAAADCGGFEGNAQSFRLLTRLEPKVAGAGLDLTRATLDAATKYPWPRAQAGPRRRKYGVYEDDREAFSWARAGAPQERRCLESQVMDWADDVAYSVHDLEDGIATGLVDPAALDEGAVVGTAAAHYSDAGPEELAAALARLCASARWPRGYDGSLQDAAALKGLTSALIGRFCDAAERATRRAHGDGPLTRYAADLHVPADVRAECAVLKAVTAAYVMRRAGVQEAQDRERALLRALVAALREDPRPLGLPVVREHERAGDDAARTRVVLDAVAALPDAAAVALWTAVGEPTGT